MLVAQDLQSKLSASPVGKQLSEPTGIPSNSTEKNQSKLGTSKRSKVRTGCRTCKIRRVKCDETRPACKRCTSTGRQCDGYAALVITNLPFDIPGNDQERRAYHFFRLRTVGLILGHQDAAYWNSLFLQVSYSQPAIKHAVIAIASLHECLELTDFHLDLGANENAKKLRALSLGHYNKAIQITLEEKVERNMRLDMVLVLCILFNVYENFYCGYAAAFMHIKGGLQLLREWRALNEGTGMRNSAKPTATSVDLVNNHVAPILTRLDVLRSFFKQSREHPTALFPELADHSQPLIPDQFTSSSQARECLDYLSNWMFYNLKKAQNNLILTEQSEIEERLNAWEIALDRYLVGRKIRQGSEIDRAAKHMKIYYHQALIVLDTYLDPDESGFDNHTARFEALVTLAQELISPSQSIDNKPQQCFSFDIALAPPLFFAATRCRAPVMRRHAVALLKTSPRGVWNSGHCAKFAEYIIQVEESALGTMTDCSDIPEQNRVRRVSAEVLFEEALLKIYYVHWPYAATTPMETGVIPLHTTSARGKLVQVDAGVTVVEVQESERNEMNGKC